MSSTCGVLVSLQLACSLVLFLRGFGLVLCEEEEKGAAVVDGQGYLEEEEERAALGLGAGFLILAVDAGRKEEV